MTDAGARPKSALTLAVTLGFGFGFVLVLGGCVDVFDPQVGPPVHARCTDTDSDPDVAVSFARDLLPVFEERCNACHSPDGRLPIGIQVGGLDMSSYSGLRAGGTVGGTRTLLPGQPCASVLSQKIGPSPPFGGRMPISGPPFLDDAEIQRIHDWIAEGALEN